MKITDLSDLRTSDRFTWIYFHFGGFTGWLYAGRHFNRFTLNNYHFKYGDGEGDGSITTQDFKYKPICVELERMAKTRRFLVVLK